jgi:N-acetylgalactosamine-N,N'-diacetylbacillosaminyl-diphospho-undecaprenol 4-alpha-N-acetylgalactosaminyltransferase
MINSLSSGGAEKVLTKIANELIKQNFEVEVIFLERNEFYKLDDRVKKTYLSSLNGTENGFKKFLYIPIFAWKLKNYIEQNNINLIQSHLYRANYINVMAKLLGVNHQAQIVNAGRISRYKELGLNGKINLWLINKLYSKADLIISKAQGMQKDMQNLFEFRGKQVVINNPYDIEKIQKLSLENIDDFTFNKDKKYLISVGRLIPLKRNHELINSLQYLNNYIDIIFIGDGSERENLIHLVEQLNLKDRIHFLGQVQNPYKYLAKVDIFVSCSESEGFPSVLVEAMICGVPVVSSDCISGPKEILSPNGKNEFGLLFKVGDTNKMVENIKYLLENDDSRNNYIINAKDRATDFALNTILNKYKEVLNI